MTVTTDAVAASPAYGYRGVVWWAGRLAGRLWQANCSGFRDHESQKGQEPMPRAPIIDDWRKLSKVARKEHDPKKFVYLLKQLYDVVNERKEGQFRHFVRAVGS